MDIKGLIRRDRQRMYQTDSAFVDNYMEQLAYEQWRDNENKKRLQEEEKAVRELEQAEEERKHEINRNANEIKTETTVPQFDKTRSVVQDWAKIMQNQPKWFSTLDKNGNVRTYYQTPEEIEERRNRIASIPSVLRSQEDAAYYEQLSPEYIKRASDLWDIAKTYAEAQDNKEIFGSGIMGGQAVIRSLYNDPATGMYVPDTTQTENLLNVTERVTDDKWLDDAFASYVQKKNIVEVETDAGGIIKNQELRQYLNRINEYSDAAATYIDLYNQYQDNERRHNIAPIFEGHIPTPLYNETKERLLNNMQQLLDFMQKNRDGVLEATSYSLGSNYGYSVSSSASRVVNIFDKYIKDGLIDPSQIQTVLTNINEIKELQQRKYDELDEDDKKRMRRADKNQQELRRW